MLQSAINDDFVLYRLTTPCYAMSHSLMGHNSLMERNTFIFLINECQLTAIVIPLPIPSHHGMALDKNNKIIIIIKSMDRTSEQIQFMIIIRHIHHNGNDINFVGIARSQGLDLRPSEFDFWIIRYFLSFNYILSIVIGATEMIEEPSTDWL